MHLHYMLYRLGSCIYNTRCTGSDHVTFRVAAECTLEYLSNALQQTNNWQYFLIKHKFYQTQLSRRNYIRCFFRTSAINIISWNKKLEFNENFYWKCFLQLFKNIINLSNFTLQNSNINNNLFAFIFVDI